MPLIHFHVYEGQRTEDEITALLDAAHEAMLDAYKVPRGDRYQLVSEHKPSHMIMEDTGLGIPRTKRFVLVQVFSRPRGDEANATFYRLLTERLNKDCGLESSDVMISLVENGDAHWSFGYGRAQFLTGELGAPKPN